MGFAPSPPLAAGRLDGAFRDTIAAGVILRMPVKDYYKTLGVERNADAAAIKKAFRKLARQHHPDVNKGDKQSEERFKEINSAYETLSDPEKRKMYDQFGSNYERMQQAGGGPTGAGGTDWSEMFRQSQQGGGAAAGGFEPSSIFESLFGGSPAPGQTVRAPRDFQQEVEITLLEAYQGTTRVVRRNGQEIEIAVPAGVKSGSKIRVRGQGGRNARNQAGDLYLIVTVAADAVYERKEDDLYRGLGVDVFTAMIGGEVSAETMAGHYVVRVPAGTSSGKLVRLRGKGMPRLEPKGEFGDLYLRIQINVPGNLADDDRKALEKMAKRYTS